MTKIAGCSFVAPPTGSSRRPGACRARGCDRAADACHAGCGRADGRGGAEHELPDAQQRAVVGRAHGLVLARRPPGPGQQARRAPAVAATSAARRGGPVRRSTCAPWSRRSGRCCWTIRTVPSTGSASAKSRTIEASSGRIWPPPAWSGIADDDVRAALPRRRRELGQQQDRGQRHADQDRHDHQHPDRDEHAGAARSAPTARCAAPAAAGAASGRCARRGPARRSRRRGCGSRRRGSPARAA